MALADEIFAWLELPGHSAVTSTITMTELLVKPLRSELHKAAPYYALLSSYPGLMWIAPDLETCARAAYLRAAHRLPTPDALQVATALQAGVGILFSNDHVLRRVPELEVVLLDDLLRG